ncbi:MAG: glycosyltransferase family 4 protein [Niveispirillum sp.]|uniref:glycosyltransferase family 4 protein n=1 Tax=Niveispirillum sp. TaxID=1917217 RepID=UPI003BA78E14
MRHVLIHDFGGYAFIVQLGRWLARQGITVTHAFAAGLAGPNQGLGPRPDDPPRFRPVAIGHPDRLFDRYGLMRRIGQEIAYGRDLGRLIRETRPDVVLAANTPPLIQAAALIQARRAGAGYVNWVQDIFSVAATRLGPGRGAARRLLGRAVGAVEFATMRRADALILIAPAFREILAAQGVHHPRTAVIGNWAPIDIIQPLPRRNAWSAAQGLDDHFVFLCAGTLGLKHDPGLILDLARAFADDPAVAIVVVSQGPGRDFLEGAKRSGNYPGLRLLDYQPADRVPEMLATADVAVALLRAEAGGMSVPSKVASYLAAGRPILAGLPLDNAAAALITGTGAGLCADSSDPAGLIAAARTLRQDEDRRRRHGAAAAEAAHAFDIDRIGPVFLDLLRQAAVRPQAG